jgi:hypothetical protein
MGSLRVRPQESALLQPEGWVPTIPFTLKPKGRLVAQCGGKDNIARTQNAMEQVMGDGRFPKVFTGLEDPWNFAAAKTKKARLEAAGVREGEHFAAMVATWFAYTEESSSWTTCA